MRKRTPMPPEKALRLTKLLFYGGLGLAVIVYFACQSTLWQERDFPSLLAALAVLGLLGVLAGLGVAVRKLRCPHCGASLMAGGRIPGRPCPASAPTAASLLRTGNLTRNNPCRLLISTNFHPSRLTGR